MIPIVLMRSSGLDVKAWLRCVGCQSTYNIDQHDLFLCPKCCDPMEIEYDWNLIDASSVFHSAGALGVWRYRALLPIGDETPIITLIEGGTGLIRCGNLERKLGLKHLYVKNEGENPTGSFKDRGMTVGVTRAIELGVKGVICASTGNTAASMSAYAARGGLDAFVVVPKRGVAEGKLLQSLVYGAKVIMVESNFDEALRDVLEAQRKRRLYLLNSVNPYRLEGQKTLAFEIYEQTRPTLPDTIFIPVGNGGNISALWKGFRELVELGLVERPPRLVAVQAEGASPIVHAYEAGSHAIQSVQRPETIASAIKIGSPMRWKEALNAIRESHGSAVAVSDEEIRNAQALLARLEGVFVEPASAATLAGLIRLLDNKWVHGDERIVCILTGNGLKDHEAGRAIAGEPQTLTGKIEEMLP